MTKKISLFCYLYKWDHFLIKQYINIKNINDEKFVNTKALNKPNNFIRKNIKLCIDEAYLLSNLAKKEIRTVENQTKNFDELY